MVLSFCISWDDGLIMLQKLSRAFRLASGYASSQGQIASNYIAPEYSGGSVVMDENGFPVMWFWVDDSQSSPIVYEPATYTEIDGIVYKKLTGNQPSLQIGENVWLVSVNIATVFNIICSEGIKILVSGVNTFALGSTLVVGSDSIISGHTSHPEMVNLEIQVKDTAKRSEISGFKVSCNNAIISKWHCGIKLLATSDCVPEDCAVKNIIGYHMENTFAVHAAKNCIFSNITSFSCIRPHMVYSGDACTFEKIKSYCDVTNGVVSFPIVGFLNITERTRSFNRGIVNCTYRDITIDGWSEEGFSFDGRGNEAEKRALVFNGHIDGAAASGITLVNKVFSGDLSRLDVIFHTGALAGRRYPVASSSPGSVSLDRFSNDYQLALVGDFISIEVPCYGNVVDNCSVKGYQDPSGINVWLWGGNTRYTNPKLENCLIDIRGAANNTAPASETWQNNQCYQIPHNIKIDGATFPVDPHPRAGIFSTLSRGDYDVESLSDSSIIPDEFKMHGLDIRMGLPRFMYLADLYEVRADEVRSIDYVFPTTTLHPGTVDRR